MFPRILKSDFIESKNLIFRDINENDAEFILRLRLNPSKKQFISTTSNKVEDQVKWINKYKWIATFPSDTPFFDISIIDRYLDEIKKNQSPLYFIKSNEKRHNIFGLWSVELMDILEDDLIKKNFRKVEDWSNKIGVKIIDVNFNDFDPFININTKEDLNEAKKIYKSFKND